MEQISLLQEEKNERPRTLEHNALVDYRETLRRRKLEEERVRQSSRETFRRCSSLISALANELGYSGIAQIDEVVVNEPATCVIIRTKVSSRRLKIDGLNNMADCRKVVKVAVDALLEKVF